MMQKVQRWSQPFCTCTMARVRPSKLSTRCGAVSFAAMMSLTTIFSSAAMPKSFATSARWVSRHTAPLSFSSLPSTRSTSRMPANVAGSVCAAQPVTTMRACGRSRASVGDTGATVPGAHRGGVARRDMRERDVGTLGKHRMVLQHRADPAEIVGIDVVDPEHRMRVAHVHGRWRVQDRLVDRPDLQLDGASVAKLLGERNLVPGKARLAHVDGRDQRLIALPAVEDSR